MTARQSSEFMRQSSLPEECNENKTTIGSPRYSRCRGDAHNCKLQAFNQN
jgi:hypothetical protein